MAVRILSVILSLVAFSGCDKLRSVYAAEPWKWSASRTAETKRRGEVICHAIDAYRARSGKYPAELADLQPAFLKQIPQPTVGYKKWHYMLIDGGTDYWLKVGASEWGPQLNKTGTGGWEYMDDHGTRNI